MSVDTFVRQSESDYCWAEYIRRYKESDAARVVERGAYALLREKQAASIGFRETCTSLGLDPFKGQLAVVEEALWEERQTAAREWRYFLAVVENCEAAHRAAFDRYKEASNV